MSDQPEQSFGSFEPSAISGGSGNAFIPIAVALVGAVLGIVAIIVALSRSGPSAEVRSEMERLQESNLSLTARLDALEQVQGSFTDAAEAGKRTQEQLQNLRSSTQTALDQIGVAIRQTNQHVGNNAEKIAELVKTLNEWAARGSVPSSTGRSAAAASVVPAGGSRDVAPTAVTGAGGAAAIAREHTIEPGDTFSRLAKRYSVSISAILEANPDVDPRRLMPGQRIRIPAP